MENRQNKPPEGGAASGHGGQKFHTDSEQAKLHKSKLRMESREERLNKARERLAKQKPPKKPGPIKRIARIAGHETHTFLHGKVYQEERDNVGVEGGHFVERSGEAALHYGRHKVRRAIREHPAKAAARAESRYIKATADYHSRKFAQEQPEAQSAAARLWHRHKLKREYQRKARETAKQTAKAAEQTASAMERFVREAAAFVKRHPVGTLLALGCLLVVLTLQSCMSSLVTVGNGATEAVKEQIESFGSNQLMLRKGQRMGPGGAAGAPSFKLEDVEALEDQIAGVLSAAPQSQRSTIVVANGKNWTTTIIGSSSDYFTTDNRTLAEGRFFEPAEEMSGAAVCVIGTTIQKELFGPGAPVIGEMLRVNSFSCRIVGLLNEKGTAAMGGDQDDLVVIPFNTAARRLIGNNRVNTILISIDPQSDRVHLKGLVRDLMRERRSLSEGDDDNFSILDTAEVAEKVASTTQIMTALLGAVAAVSLLVGGIGIMNIMLVSVTERTREIGVRLAIGATAREVLMQFLIEAVVLGCMGGVIGILLATGSSYLITGWMDVPYTFDPMINIVSFAFAALTGVIFGYFPARRAARLDPIEAVRHE